MRELQAALRLPQSTVSRHLKVLADLGLVAIRSEGTSNWYRMPGRELDPGVRRLWQAVREEVAAAPEARRDAERLERVLAERHKSAQRFFDREAGRWDRLRQELFGDRAGLLGLLGLLDAGWTVGDFGCGTGELTAALAPFVHQVIGVDESAAMLQAARERTRKLSNVELRRGSLAAPPVAAEELDAALLVLVLHHVSDPARELAAARRTLKPRGRLLVVDMLPHEHAEYQGEMGHQWLGFGEEALRAWFTEAGFATARIVPLPHDPAAKGPPLFAATAGVK